MAVADITPGYSGHPWRASGFRPGDVWLGAGGLDVLTAVAMLTANNF
jgi:hypothetical protein